MSGVHYKVQAFLGEFPFVQRYLDGNLPLVDVQVKSVDGECLGLCAYQMNGEWSASSGRRTEVILLTKAGLEVGRVAPNNLFPKLQDFSWFKPWTWFPRPREAESVSRAINRIPDANRAYLVLRVDSRWSYGFGGGVTNQKATLYRSKKDPLTQLLAAHVQNQQSTARRELFANV